VGDRRTERAVGGALGLDVDPLAVAGCFGEGGALGLRDLVPRADAELLPAELGQLADGHDAAPGGRGRADAADPVGAHARAPAVSRAGAASLPQRTASA